MDTLAAKPLDILAAPGHEITREQFAALIRPSDFKKIEAALDLHAPSDGFLQSIISICWKFYENSSPQAEIKVSRAVRKEALQELATLYRRAAELTTSIWGSGDWAVVAELSESVVGVDALDKHAVTVARIADGIPDDKGGHRDGLAFDHLLRCLGNYYREFKCHTRCETRAQAAWDDRIGKWMRGETKEPEFERQFFRFAATVTDMLRDLKTWRRGEVPPSDPALRRWLYRLNAKRPESRMT